MALINPDSLLIIYIFKKCYVIYTYLYFIQNENQWKTNHKVQIYTKPTHNFKKSQFWPWSLNIMKAPRYVSSKSTFWWSFNFHKELAFSVFTLHTYSSAKYVLCFTKVFEHKMSSNVPTRVQSITAFVDCLHRSMYFHWQRQRHYCAKQRSVYKLSSSTINDNMLIEY